MKEKNPSTSKVILSKIWLKYSIIITVTFFAPVFFYFCGSVGPAGCERKASIRFYVVKFIASQKFKTREANNVNRPLRVLTLAATSLTPRWCIRWQSQNERQTMRKLQEIKCQLSRRFPPCPCICWALRFCTDIARGFWDSGNRSAAASSEINLRI